MKEGETDGIGFRFYDLEAWSALKDAGGLLETTEFAGNDYGTSREFVVQLLDAGKNVLLSLEPDRAAQVKQNFPAAVCIWVEPSDETLLRERFSQRARSEREIEVRLRAAAEQRAASGFCDLRIADDDPATTLRTLNEAIEA
jgi:guanylate kinase